MESLREQLKESRIAVVVLPNKVGTSNPMPKGKKVKYKKYRTNRQRAQTMRHPDKLRIKKIGIF